MRKTLYIIILALGSCLSVAAQSGVASIDSVLSDIERNNKQLQALAYGLDATELEIKAQNNLEQSLGIEYSPFWAPGVQGVASSEMVVRMGFDFPTKYAARAKSGRLQMSAAGHQYMAARRDILLEARILCFDLVRLNKEYELLAQRQHNASALLDMVQRNFDAGGASILDLNKVKMEMMSLRTQIADNEAARIAALGSLKAFNAGEDVIFELCEYPEVEALASYDIFYQEIMQQDAELLTAQANVEVAAQDVKVNRQNWVPEIEIGYRRNTAIDEASNGFLVGASFPIFAGASRTKAAKAQHQKAQAELESVRLQTEADVEARYNELLQLQALLEVYDVELMTETIAALDKAVTSGALSIIDYYSEVDRVYDSLLSLMEVENRYQKLLAEVYKYRL